MTYATKQDLIERFGETELLQLTDRINRPPQAIDDAVVDRALADADALADGFVGKVAKLPLAAVPPALTKVCADLARYYLHGKSAEKDGAVARAHNEAMGWLRDVARGLVQLDLGPAGGSAPAEPAGGGAIRAKRADRVFTRDTLRSM